VHKGYIARGGKITNFLCSETERGGRSIPLRAKTQNPKLGGLRGKAQQQRVHSLREGEVNL